MKLDIYESAKFRGSPEFHEHLYFPTSALQKPRKHHCFLGLFTFRAFLCLSLRPTYLRRLEFTDCDHNANKGQEL